MSRLRLVPTLAILSLLAPDAPGQERKPEKLPAPSATNLFVEVVDTAGKPCAKVPVALVLRRGDALANSPLPQEEQKKMVRRGDFLSAYLVIGHSGEKDGRVGFDLAAHPIAPQEFESCVARLCLPLVDPIEVVFDPKKLPDQPLRLVRPDCGSVRFELSGIEKGSVRIRAFDESDEIGPIWNESAPDRFDVAAGVAQIPFAVVGVELAYEAKWQGLGTPLTGHFPGPSRAGEEVRFAPPSLASYPRLHGRIVDEEANAVANRKIDFSVTLTQKGKETSTRAEAVTDGGGFFDFAVVAEILPGCKGTLRCSAAAAAQGEKDLGAADALVDLKKLLPGPNEVGEVVLVAPGSLRWLARLSDDELQKTYESRKSTSGTRRLDVEACLVEMGRRKSERWKKYLASELAALHPAAKPKSAKPGKGHDAGETGEADADLSLLTALRRAQGKPDPLAIVLGAPPPYDAIFPETPKVAFSLKNVDASKETFGITEGGSYRSGRFARIHVEATGPDGARVAVRTQFGMMGGGMSGRSHLAAGESRAGEIKLGDFISFPGPGVYQVRLCYHDSEEIANADRIDGYVVATSPEFTVRLKSQSVTVKRADLDALKEKWKAIDFTEKVPLVAGHWSPDLKFEGAPKTPQDHVFRAGYAAVPMLFELLDDATLTIEQRSWVFGLLWDITGINNPEHGEFFAAVKDPVWLTDWPGSLVKTHPDFNEFGNVSGGGWPDHQKGLAARWKLMKSWFDVKIVK